MSPEPADRPPLSFMGPYNVRASQFEGPVGPIWTETDDLEELTYEEFLGVRTTVVEAIRRHSTVYGKTDRDPVFYVYDDKFFDRSQKVEITPSATLPEELPAVVGELQQALKKHPLWRIMFIAEGYDHQAEETYFVVYPDAVRIKQLTDKRTIAEAVKENALLRFRFQQQRQVHREKRREDLREAVINAIQRLDGSEDAVVLVAWYDTLTAIDWEWGYEGKPGTSLWLLSRSPVENDQVQISSDAEFYQRYWASADGKIQGEQPTSGEHFQLLLLENNEKVLTNVEVDIRGETYVFKK